MITEKIYKLKCPYNHKEWHFISKIEKGDLLGLIHCPHCGTPPSIEELKEANKKF